MFEHFQREEGSLELDERGMEFIRGGMVSLIAAWESYVLDILDETFQLVTEICSCSGKTKSPGILKERWPGCEEITTNGLRLSDYLNSDSEEDLDKVKTILDQHRIKVLHHTGFSPVFSKDNPGGKRTIDEIFRQLFKTEKSISQILIEVADGHYRLQTGSGPKYQYQVKLK